jgi:hypothetical protein
MQVIIGVPFARRSPLCTLDAGRFGGLVVHDLRSNHSLALTMRMQVRRFGVPDAPRVPGIPLDLALLMDKSDPENDQFLNLCHLQVRVWAHDDVAVGSLVAFVFHLRCTVSPVRLGGFAFWRCPGACRCDDTAVVAVVPCSGRNASPNIGFHVEIVHLAASAARFD